MSTNPKNHKLCPTFYLKQLLMQKIKWKQSPFTLYFSFYSDNQVIIMINFILETNIYAYIIQLHKLE